MKRMAFTLAATIAQMLIAFLFIGIARMEFGASPTYPYFLLVVVPLIPLVLAIRAKTGAVLRRIGAWLFGTAICVIGLIILHPIALKATGQAFLSESAFGLFSALPMLAFYFVVVVLAIVPAWPFLRKPETLT